MLILVKETELAEKEEIKTWKMLNITELSDYVCDFGMIWNINTTKMLIVKTNLGKTDAKIIVYLFS